MKAQGLAGKVEYAQFLHDGSEVKFTDGTVELLSDFQAAGTMRL